MFKQAQVILILHYDNMADDFSQSLTPPVSPFAADSLCELSPAQPPCFCCSETKDDPTGALSTEGYTARGSLKRYLEPSSSLDACPSHPYEDLEAQLPSALLEELFGITLLIGRLKDLPANVQSAFTIQNQGKIFPPSWHLLHLHLDIHWSVLEILHLLSHKMQGQVVYAHQFVNLTGENLTDAGLFEEHLCSLLCDLTGLAIGKYSKVRPTEALSSHHYLCSCTKELWVLLMHLLEYRNKVLHTQSFWSYMNLLLRPLVLGKPAAEQFSGLPTHCKDPLGFTWWLVTHLAVLGQYSRNGTVQSEKHLSDNWTFVEELLKLTCNPKGGLAEEQVRMHVHCCLSLCLLWEPSTSAVSTLWDYYSKNLNVTFTVPWLGMSGLGTLCKTPLALVEQARSCCSPSPLHSPGHTQLYRSANSFHIFLRVLALCLAQDTAGGVPQRQIKGRPPSGAGVSGVNHLLFNTDQSQEASH
ncbi:protein MMS22-like protein [Lates japonicus]|uniref:Protein MMS22-like protein n=1 Tax=Lates japonicus TaxID=270547 RepID=A0AAD3M746_LATJO|nr:protein MMS22-like protein [Lates japonicus]